MRIEGKVVLNVYLIVEISKHPMAKTGSQRRRNRNRQFLFSSYGSVVLKVISLCISNYMSTIGTCLIVYVRITSADVENLFCFQKLY